MGEAIAGTDDERTESELGVEVARGHLRIVGRSLSHGGRRLGQDGRGMQSNRTQSGVGGSYAAAGMRLVADALYRERQFAKGGLDWDG